MLAIGGAAGAASFTHVHNVAAAHGQPGWLAWADAIVLELMSIASGLELRRRKRAHTSTVFPAVVLACAVTLSLAAQVVEAEPSPIGWIAAAVPALGFLVMVKIALGYAGTPTRTSALQSEGQPPDRSVPPTHPIGPAERKRFADTAGERATGRTVRPPGAVRHVGGPDRRRTAGRGPSTHRATDTDELLPGARRVRDRRAADGQALTRAALAEALRAAGHTVSNTRVSELLKILKAESTSPSGNRDGHRSSAAIPAPPSAAGRRPAADTSAPDATPPAAPMTSAGISTAPPEFPDIRRTSGETRP